MQVMKKSMRWQGSEDGSIEHLVVETIGDAMVMDAAVLTGDPETGLAAVRYRLYADGAGRTRRFELQRIGEGHSLRFKSNGLGEWTDDEGDVLPGLAGAIDIDLPLTPATNALPIRRLALEVGQSADIDVVYITWPELMLSLEPQRYTRVAADRYLFESLESDFRCEITVDADGFVLDYPGLFQRI